MIGKCMVNNKKYLWYYSKLFSRFENVMPTKHADIRISVKLIFQKKKRPTILVH